MKLNAKKTKVVVVEYVSLSKINIKSKHNTLE